MNTLNCGEHIHFGNFFQNDNNKEPIEWIVVDVNENKAKLLSFKCLRSLPFNVTTGFFTWKNSSIRRYLNDGFYNEAFISAEKETICDEEIYTGGEHDRNDLPIEKTTDRVYLMSRKEVSIMNNNDDSFSGFGNMCYLTKFAKKENEYFNLAGLSLNDYVLWWTRSSGKTPKSKTIIGSRVSNYSNGEKSVGVRPMITIDIEKFSKLNRNEIQGIRTPEELDSEEIAVPEGTEIIQANAYVYRNFKRIIIPESVKLIEDQAFAECSRFETVVLQNPRCKISPKAFYNCNVSIVYEFDKDTSELISSMGKEAKDFVDKMCKTISGLRASPQEIKIDDDYLVFIIEKTLYFAEFKIIGDDCELTDIILEKVFGLNRISGKLVYMPNLEKYNSLYLHK